MIEFDVIWNRYDKKFRCVIGYLSYDGIWNFKYDEEGVEIASTIGFVGFPEFPNIMKTYQSPTLFRTFDNRIRRNNTHINELAKIDLLDKTNAILATDNISISRTNDLSKERKIIHGKN